MGKQLAVTVPDGVPEEKKLLLRMLGAEVWATPDEAAAEALELIENPTTRVIDTSTARRVHPDLLSRIRRSTVAVRLPSCETRTPS